MARAVMQLLVSVANREDAEAALDGGADIIDTKDPGAGPLGPVILDVFAAVASVVGGARPLSAALGEPRDEVEAATLAGAFTAAGAAFVKVGVRDGAGTTATKRLLTATRHGAHGQVIAVAYADAGSDLTRMRIVEAAIHAGVAGVLLDTADKHGPGLCDLLSPDGIDSWTSQVAAAGLIVALAGKLTADDVARLWGRGAAIIGVRGAACEGGRAGRIARDRVRGLKAAARANLQVSTQWPPSGGPCAVGG